MAYKYFSKQIIEKNLLDLNDVFPEKQELAKESNNISYGLADIVIYIQDSTNNFRVTDSKYVDLDSAIREIVKKWYKSQNLENPFDVDTEELVFDTYQEGVVPREPASVEDGKLKGMGIVAPKKVAKVEALPTPTPTPTPTTETIDDKINKVKKELESLQFLLDLEDDEQEKQQTLNIIRKRIDGLEILIEDEDSEEFDKKRYELYKDFVNKNS
jgi:hypothetical protein